MVEQLFFGRNLNGQQVVSDSAWAAFVGDVVTPRFPSGFTVWQAVGQWRGADGRIEHEPSFVLEVVHPPSRTADADVVAVIEAYKARFHQESVLRVTAPARVAF